MPSARDPTDPIRKHAAKLADVDQTAACTQSGFKVNKRAFLYIGPGAKGQGFKAMFKLEASIAQAEQLAAKEPARYGVGSTGWVSVRFTAEEPLAKTIWEKWLKESYSLASGGGAKKAAKKKKTTAKKKAKSAKKKKTTAKKKAKSAKKKKKTTAKKKAKVAKKKTTTARKKTARAQG